MSNVKVSEKSGREVGGLKVSLRADAVAELVARHSDEFHSILGALYAAKGLTYEPPLTDEEKAAQTIAALVEKYPSLAGQVAPVTSVQRIVVEDEETNVDLGISEFLSKATPA